MELDTNRTLSLESIYLDLEAGSSVICQRCLIKPPKADCIKARVQKGLATMKSRVATSLATMAQALELMAMSPLSDGIGHIFGYASSLGLALLVQSRAMLSLSFHKMYIAFMSRD